VLLQNDSQMLHALSVGPRPSICTKQINAMMNGRGSNGPPSEGIRLPARATDVSKSYRPMEENESDSGVCKG
jgi:hypothetical protein